MNSTFSIRDIPSTDRSIAFLVFGFLLACYLFTFTGVIESSDGLAMFATVESMARRGEVDSNQLIWMGTQQGDFGPDGDLYSRKGLGMPLLALPLVWVAKIWSAIGLVQAALLLNPLLTAWTGALIYRSGMRLGWRRHTSVMTALVFGLGTLAWPYTQTFFSDPVCGWGLFAGFYGLLSFRQTGRKRYLLGGGAAWGLAYLARVINLATLPIYAIALIVIVYRWARERERWAQSPPTRAFDLLLKNWRPLISFGVPVVVAGLLSLWWNWLRYGHILTTGYAETERFDAIWWFGISGLLAGPARGLFWYSPILLLAIPGAIWFWRRQRGLLGFILAITAIYILLYGKWYMWHGGYSWGPRFLVPLMPFLALLVGPAWDRLAVQRRWGFLGMAGAVALLAVSIGVQWLGMLVPFSLVQDWLVETVQPLFAPETFTSLAYTPLRLQWRFLSPETIQFAWWQTSPWPESIDWLGLLTPLVGVLVGIYVIVRQIRESDRIGETGSHHNWLYGIALCFIAVGILTYYQTPLSGAEMQRATQRIESQERPGDAIISLLPEQYQQFANVYHGELPMFGFLPAREIDGVDQGWLDRLVTTYQRVWVTPDYTPAVQSGWERPLRGEHFLLFDTRMSEPDGQRLSLYATAGSAPMVESGLGTIFGDPSLGDATVTAENGWIRLDGYAVTPEVRPGESMLVELRWQSLRDLDYDYHVFVHLLNANGEKLAQRDGQPVQWMWPTSVWQPGQEVTDRYALLLPENFPQGEYKIAVGWYDPLSGQRLPVSAGRGDYAIEIGPISVVRER